MKVSWTGSGCSAVSLLLVGAMSKKDALGEYQDFTRRVFGRNETRRFEEE